MPYLNLDLDYFSHPKVVRLVGLLGSEHIAVPIRLWCYVGKYHCATGMLEAYSIAEIESAVNWQGKSGQLVEALLKIKFVDKIKNGYRIHDWLDHAGHLTAFKKRAITAAKKRWNVIATSNAISTPKVKITNAPNHPNHPNHPTKREKKLIVDVRRVSLGQFELTKELQDWAMTEYKIVVPVHVVDEFKQHWLDQPNSKLKTNWALTFKNRIGALVGWGTLKPQAITSNHNSIPKSFQKLDNMKESGEDMPEEVRAILTKASRGKGMPA